MADIMVSEREIIVGLHAGVHARPASKIVKLSRQFEADITLYKNEKSANCRSSLQLILLNVRQNDHLVIKAIGNDAEKAVAVLATFLDRPDASLEEQVDQDSGVSKNLDNAIYEGSRFGGRAMPGGNGAAIGQVSHFLRSQLDISSEPSHSYQQELNSLNEVIKIIASRLRHSDVDKNSASHEILNALADLIDDEAWIRRICDLIESGFSADHAVSSVSEGIINELRKEINDETLDERIHDIKSLSRLVIMQLRGTQVKPMDDVPEGAIVIVQDLAATDINVEDLRKLSGVINLSGSADSHASILVKGLGVPYIYGAKVLKDQLLRSKCIAMNGDSGEVFCDLGQEAIKVFEDLLHSQSLQKKHLKNLVSENNELGSSEDVNVFANIHSVEEIPIVISQGARGIGLYRSEYLYIGNSVLPGEDYQYQQYRKLAQAFSDPVTIRTFDLGGDKQVMMLPLSVLDDPNMRGLKLSLAHRDAFKTQLRALLRAATHGPLQIMFPMVSDVSDLDEALDLVSELENELNADNISYKLPPIGIMIETSSAVSVASKLAKLVDFFSVGTNDLAHEIISSDRMNVSSSSQLLTENSVFLDAVGRICDAAKEQNIPVSVCGEAATHFDFVKHAVELGVKTFSVAPNLVLQTKAYLNELSRDYS